MIDDGPDFRPKRLDDTEKGNALADAHTDFIARWYREVFLHGYKHGYEDGKVVE